MGFFKKLFGNHHAAEIAGPSLRFGRYTDSYKSAEQYAAWDASLDAFEDEAFLESYRAFFKYLRDPAEDNVLWEEKDGEIRFEIYQGSRKVTGFANSTRFKAIARVAHADALRPGFMRRLVEQNFDLKYSRFALDPDDNIAILFDTNTLDGSPYKLYYALKELATNADKLDDLLLDEFKELRPIPVARQRDLPDHIKTAKYEYLTTQIRQTFDLMDAGRLNPTQYPSAYAYLFLALIYRLDYLVKPEGFAMELLERLHRLYFAKDDQTMVWKNAQLRKTLQKLLDRPPDDLFRELYEVPATFGITSPANHDQVVGIIDGELGHMDWFVENDHPEIALAIPGYIVGYCLFQYAVPAPDRDLFHLYYQITEAPYFQSLGFETPFFNPDTRQFSPKTIKRTIKHIAEKHRPEYPDLNPDTDLLRYDSLPGFARSFLQMIKKLRVVKV
ncbi:MAG: hypothetical protein D6714_13410 [Bacteroidetes bacterium]|nr:MAG: hypothetical protein D6714_13410 [Bacteroidota bacterium]